MIGDFSTTPSASAHATPSSHAGASASQHTTAPVVVSSLGLDTQSTNALNEVRTALNLSSDIEALRALIALGYKQFKKI